MNFDLLNIETPADKCAQIAQRLKLRRKELGLTQEVLARKSGVSLGSLRRFEQTGEISLHSLARLALVIDCGTDLDQLFAVKRYRSIQEVIDENAH